MSVVTPIPGVQYEFDAVGRDWDALERESIPALWLPPLSFDFDDQANVPWKYVTEDAWLGRLELGNNIVLPIQKNAAKTFLQNATDTLNGSAAPRIILDLRNANGDPEVFHLKDFIPAGSSGIQAYAFGLWHPKLAGFIGHGPDKTIIQMDAGSVRQSQLTEMSVMVKADFAPNPLGCIRLDATTSSGNSSFIGGVGFRAEAQPLITQLGADMGQYYVPQPAPHNGLILYKDGTHLLSHVRFQGFGHALLGQPPFEHSNVGSQYSRVRIYNTESDGRRSPVLDPLQPRSCNPVMPNNEYYHLMEDCYIHHSNVSRYAANDQNRDTDSEYVVRRVKADYITEIPNSDPSINGGQDLGGASMATPFGWESSRAKISIENVLVHQRNAQPLTGGQKPAHFQMTVVASVNRQGGRFYLSGSEWHNEGHPDIDAYLIMRIGATSYWRTDGYPNTLFIYNAAGVRMIPFEYTGSFPPTEAQLKALGVLPDVHYIVVLA